MKKTDKLKYSLQGLDSDDFERLVASTWDSMGWTTELTPVARDKGIDIIASKSGVINEKVVIQAKCYSEGNKIGRPDIQQYNTLQEQVPSADSVIVVTSSSFTTEALELARQLNIKTVDGDELAEAMVKHLSKEHIQAVVDLSISSEKSRENSSAGSRIISTETLTESEKDLAQFYQQYIHRLSQVSGRSEQRSLLFDIDREPGDTSTYSVTATMHKAQFSSDDPKLWIQFQKTAKSYGWKITRNECYGEGAGGVEMRVPVEEADAFYLSFETEHKKSMSPQRQAKISSLILDHIYDQLLSGTEVVDMPLGFGGEAYRRIIK